MGVLVSQQDATTTTKGRVELATDAESAANVVVQGNDSRLSDARTPTGAAGGDLTGSTYPNPTLQGNAVTFAKMQNISTDTLIGRDTAGTGDPQEISVAGGIEFNGSSTLITSAFTGDVTKAAGGTSLTLADNTVSSSKLQDNSVLTTKIVDFLTDTLLGRDVAGTGDPTGISVSGGIEFTGSNSIQTSAFTGDVTKSAGGTALTIANDSVSNAKLANMAANTAKVNATASTADPSDISIGTNTVLGRQAGNIVAATVATNQIANDAVTNSKLANMGAQSVKGNPTGVSADPSDIIFNTNVVLGRKGSNIVAEAIDTGQINNNQVTFAKIQTIATDRLVGRDTAATGNTEEISVSGGIEFTGSGGIQSSAFTGDVTKSAGGTALTIANDAVTTSKIINDAVTYAKMQNVSVASKLLGRGDSGSGDPEEITIGSGLAMTGTTLSASGGGGGAPDSAQYVTLATDATLTQERVLTEGNNVLLTDGGAGGNVTLDVGTEDVALTGVISPAQIIANQNDYAPTGLATASVLRISSDASRNITGLTGGAAGRLLIVHNIGSNDIVLIDESVSSTAANRFALNADLTLGADNSCILQYDNTSSRWRLAASSVGSTGGGPPTGSAGGDLGGTYPNPTVVSVQSGVVDSIAIINDAVGFTKLANIATDTLIGRDTAATGDPESISVSGGIEFTGSGGIQSSAFTGDVTKSAGGTALTIANDAVTYAKMQNVSAASKLLGRGSASGAGDPEEITLGTGLSMSGTTLNSSGGGAPTTAQYVTLATDAGLSAERTLAVDGGITLSDGGANNPVTLGWNYTEQLRKKVGFFEDFLGDPTAWPLPTLDSFPNGTSAGISGEVDSDEDAYGQLTLSTGTTTTGNCSIFSSVVTASSVFLLNKGVITLISRIKLTNLSDGTNTFFIRIGLADDVDATTITDGVWIGLDSNTDTHFTYNTSKGSTQTNQTSSVVASADTWYTLTIVINAAGTSAEFFINGSSIGTITTNLPTATTEGTTYGMFIKKTAGTTIRILNVDYM